MREFVQGQSLRLWEVSQGLGLESDEFTILQVLRGGMGVCLKVRSVSTGAAYALKAVAPALASDNMAWKRFVEELKIWITLSACDGIVEAYCIGRVNELPCMCARWMEGRAVSMRMREVPSEITEHRSPGDGVDRGRCRRQSLRFQGYRYPCLLALRRSQGHRSRLAHGPSRMARV